MIRHRAATVLAALVLHAAVAHARALDLPVRDAAHPDVAAPAYRGDVFSVRLRAPVAPSLTGGRARLERLGLARVDGAAAALGAWFEPEFKGERADEPRSAAFASYVLVHLPPDVDLADALDRFAALGEVVRAEPVPIVPVTLVPNDSLWSRSAWFYQPSRHDLHAPECWDVTTGDTSIVVAILDTGVLHDHPDLRGRVAGLNGQFWTNWAEAGGQPNVDDDGNGFTDDTWGWDFVALPPGSDVRAGEDGYDADDDPNDFVGHGTNVAGLIGAIANNVSGIAGTAWNVRLMALRVGWASNRAPTGEISLEFAAEAVRYATRMGARVINCSFSTDPFSALEDAVDDATRSGVTVVIAAGNNGSANVIGVRENVFSVASVDLNDVVSRFSNRAAWVDVAAPGENLATTSITRPGSDSLGVRQPAYTPEASGTSFSCAFASGAVALVQARRVALGLPPLTPQQMILHLRETADDISGENPGLTGYGTGRINLARAVTETPRSRVTRAAALTVGPPVALRDDTGRMRVLAVTSDARLLALDGASGDTLLCVPLPGAPASGIAAADMGAGIGTALFVGLADGRVAGMLPTGQPLPGWPVRSPWLASQSFTSVALGDLDGDGVPEVVAVGTIDGVDAWHANGSRLAGFPALGGEAVTRPVALADLDGRPGVEIVAVTLAGEVHALRADGRDLRGWPFYFGQTMAAAAPVVTRFGSATEAAVVVADGTTLRALRPDASPRFARPLWNYPVADPALADLDGDGSDEIVLVTGPVLAAFDSTGTLMPGRFPVSEVFNATGDPIVGWCGGAAPGIVYRGGTGLLGFDATGAPLRGFTKPGFAGMSPLLADLDGDDATELMAGTGTDSLIYIYDLGAGSWRSAPQGWPAARGNFARTGTRLYSPPIATIDGSPPATIPDLAITSLGHGEIDVSWTAPSDPPAGARAAVYDLRRAPSAAALGDFASATPVAGVPSPSAPGTVEHARATGLTEGGTYAFAVRSRDAEGNVSATSNVVSATLPHVAPAAVRDLVVESASDTIAMLRWTATGDDGTIGRPQRYLLRAATEPIDAAGFAAAPYAMDAPASTASGGVERARFAGLPAGRRLWFALEAEDAVGTRSLLSNVATSLTGVGGPLAGRAGIGLASGTQPARAPVALWWQTSAVGENAPHRIELYDVRGRMIRAIDLGAGVGGVAQWDGRDGAGRAVRAGLYFARLASVGERTSARIVLLP